MGNWRGGLLAVSCWPLAEGKFVDNENAKKPKAKSQWPKFSVKFGLGDWTDKAVSL